MPKIKSGERKDEFLPRCTEMLIEEEDKESDEAYAICNSMWDNRDKNSEFYLSKSFIRELYEEYQVLKIAKSFKNR